MNAARRWWVLLVLAAAACGRGPVATTPSRTAGAARPTILSIVATTDVHGHVEALPWIAGHVAALRAARRADGGGVLLVDSGDMWQGTLESNLSEGGAVVRAYNALGYHAAAIGNHEFDYGPVGPSPVPRSPSDNPTGALEMRAREARFPFLAANLALRTGEPWRPRNVRPSAMVTVAGIRVGLIGVTSTTTPHSTDPRNLVRLQVLPLRDVVVREAGRLRAAGATVVVVLAHAGGRCDAFADPDDLASCRPQSEVLQLARSLPPGLVDVIAAGHTHLGIAHRVNGIAVVQGFELGKAFSRVDLDVDRTAGRVTAQHIHPPRFVCDGRRLQPITSWSADACAPPPYEARPVRYEARLLGVLRRDIEAARQRREQLLGVDVAQRYWSSAREESPAGNLVVDLLHATRPDSDVALYNGGGTRAALPPGPVTYGAVYALLPFDDVIATATLKAGTLADALRRGLTGGRLPVVSGVEVDVTCESGSPRVSLSRGGHPIAPDTPLSLVTTEFLSAGGDGLFQPGEPEFTLQLGTQVREAIVGVLPREAERIRAGMLGSYDPERRRVRFPQSALPVRCDAASQ